MGLNNVQVNQQDFNINDAHTWLRQGSEPCGAVVTFTGIVRDLAEGGLKGLYLEHYPGMTERALEDIIARARQRWQLGRVLIHHRVGWLQPDENIVLLGVASAHRAEAFAAAAFIMDYLKQDAPFWKKERLSGEERWVEQKGSDREAVKRWQSPGN
ncbi:molybdopterin synthase catalytic subunit MoaE [Marinobacterium sp. AK62]|uniref:Molybdopterin synthase catalytic subunit n=1 Tax=Marinobacterium alkalitolerans TaxID=1542925 RepID=A0ABS3ZBS8_9GAMM|nr:molybdopterin synthase catalytic subunit MoaE [Marinobacterium alkalitolerans]MBP0049161.1 molybdopterin synthase catalytic subunit MoaE [Marinobacterium alkalitolerans]